MHSAVPAKSLDTADLERQVKDMYQAVAEDPLGDFHFEMGRGLAERLGYSSDRLDRIPAGSIDSFAGVGYHFGLAALQPGEAVVDLGSGSGMDAFFAALEVGAEGEVVGVDMTDAQLAKATSLREEGGFQNVSFTKAYIEDVPLADARFDVVISNGVINLAPEKSAVFHEVARLLRSGGRMAISDIVTDVQLPMGITCNANLWAACIGGAMQRNAYREAIEGAGLRVERLVENPQYRFISTSALGATEKYGVKSVSVFAVKV